MAADFRCETWGLGFDSRVSLGLGGEKRELEETDGVAEWLAHVVALFWRKCL